MRLKFTIKKHKILDIDTDNNKTYKTEIRRYTFNICKYSISSKFKILNFHHVLYGLYNRFSNTLKINLVVNIDKNYFHKNSYDYTYKALLYGAKPRYYYDDYDCINKLISKEHICHIVKLNEVRIIGGSNVVLLNNKQALFEPYWNDESDKWDHTNSVIRYINNSNMLIMHEDSQEIFSAGIMLSGNASYNYYHFLYEFLSKYILIKKLKLNPDIPIIVDDAVVKTPQFKELLEYLNKDNRDIIYIKSGYSYQVKSLYYLPFVNIIPRNYKNIDTIHFTDNLFSFESIQFLRDNLMPKKASIDSNKRIFISRKNASTVRRYNEIEVSMIFEKHGFEVVYPEDYSVAEQMSLFNNAEFIAGATGAAFTNILFCNQGCKILCIISFYTELSIFSTIAKYLGLDFQYLSANEKSYTSQNLHEDFVIDPFEVESVLVDFLSVSDTKVFNSYEYRKIKNNHKRALEVANKKDHIQVVFLLLLSSNWKYDSVYKVFARDKHYSPVVVICPLIGHGDDAQEEEMRKAKTLCEINQYNYYDSWDSETNTWKDIKTILKPDIVFFSNPHNITKQEFCIENFLDTLTCYVPYSIRTDHLVDMAFNTPFQQLTWINFYETIIHKEIAEECSKNKGDNVIVVGYPTTEMIDAFSVNQTRSNKKKIIWAPHWTIKESPLLNRACFLEYYNFFIELSKEYGDLIEIVLRPHPFLKRTLYEIEGWGKKRTDDYFDLWQTSSNLSISDGEYYELFALSDVLVHDSVSFLAEYLVTGKPAIFTKRQVDSDPPFNKFGILCLDAHYICKSPEQLRDLIVDILFNHIDIKENDRLNLVNKYLRMEKTASENIFRTIEESLNG